ncbi:hypothetical protein GONAM_30_00020 [Gordonia namibiensis NBRC 108229]|uniref:Uncharacterized protein n=1 Tax=Gordonia namibiensis NBRC 108229 TaxID=1208314 RepID=K6VZ99_9ACTN|nr:hypothetical protein GONAM_30_00020 [Gordonia namibiensis NBRC 108229]
MVLMTRVTPSAGLCDGATSVPSGPAPGVEVKGVVMLGVGCTGSVVSSEPVSSDWPRSSARDTFCVGSYGDWFEPGAEPGGT